MKRRKPFIDLTGQRFGRYTVLKYSKRKGGKDFWLCQCDCGQIREVEAFNLKLGNTKSCGCLKNEGNNKTHGMSYLKIHRVWRGIIQRCTNSKDKSYSRYGGREIKICPEWLNSFEQFITDMGLPPKGFSIERIDNDGNYEPSNCRWATPKEQANNRRNSHILELNGKSQTPLEWAKELNIPVGTIYSRLEKGFPIEKVLSTGGVKSGKRLKSFKESS